MLDSMTPSGPNRARIGIPWRTAQEGWLQKRSKVQDYADAVRQAGGEPELLPLNELDTLEARLAELDGFVLPGSPADVEPA